jgi:hypothetical protein
VARWPEASADAKRAADSFKVAGNALFAADNFAGAVEQYSQAIALDKRNHVCVLQCHPRSAAARHRITLPLALVLCALRVSWLL